MSNAEPMEIREDGLTVVDKRVTVPSYIGSEGDIVQATLIVESGEEENFGAEIQSKNRITIPVRLRTEHSIQNGDHVDIRFTQP